MAFKSSQGSTGRHPLQRIPSPSRGVSALFHLASLVSFGLNFRYLLVTPSPVKDSYGWHLQYLTIIGLALSTICFSVALVADITLSSKLFLAKNYLIIASAPLEVLITTLYWGLRQIDPALVIPKFAQPPPIPIDLGFHVIPAVVMVVDILFFSPPWTMTAPPYVILSSVIAVAYWIWIEECHRNNGFYPYLIFESVDVNGRLGLFALSAIVMTAGMVTLKNVYGLINGWETKASGDLKKSE